MRLLWSLAGQAARVAIFGSALRRLKKKTARFAMGLGLILMLGPLGLILILAGVRAEIEAMIGPVWSPIAIGGILILGSLVAYFVFMRPRKADESKAEEQ